LKLENFFVTAFLIFNFLINCTTKDELDYIQCAGKRAQEY